MSEFRTFSGTERIKKRPKTTHNPCVVDLQLTGKVFTMSKAIYQESVTAKNPIRIYHSFSKLQKIMNRCNRRFEELSSCPT